MAGGVDAGEVCPIQDLCVRDFSLPMDVEEVPKASDVNVINFFYVSYVDGFAFISIA